MNKEDYVSLEVAKLLKEKGFDYSTLYYYEKNGKLGMMSLDAQSQMRNHGYMNDVYPCPTLYEAAKWLRETHNIHIVVSPHYSRKYEIIEYEYSFDFLEKPFKWRKSKEYYEIYEQCLNNAILESLKLI